MGMILQDDWDVYNAIYKFLKVFYTVTNDFSSIYNFENHKNLPIFKNTCDALEINFLKYWMNLPTFFMLLAIMNPMIKLSGVEFFITAINELLNANLTIIDNNFKLAVTTLYY